MSILPWIKKNYLFFVPGEQALEKGKQAKSFTLQRCRCTPLVSAHSLLYWLLQHPLTDHLVGGKSSSPPLYAGGLGGSQEAGILAMCGRGAGLGSGEDLGTTSVSQSWVSSGCGRWEWAPEMQGGGDSFLAGMMQSSGGALWKGAVGGW